MKFSDLNMKTQILVSFAAITTISLLLITIVSINNVGTIGDSINSRSTDALESQIITNMKISAEENANIIQNKFQNAEASVARIVEATKNAFSGNYEFGYVTSYQDNETEVSLPNSSLNDNYGEFISPTTSTYYYPSSALVGGEITSSMNDTINKSAQIDNILSSIWKENPEYVWLYISFEDGIFRNFPGAHVDETKEYIPTEEGWHKDAINARGKLTYSPPYIDITQGLVISLTQAVYINNIPIAVVGLDFKTTTIQDKVLDVNFLDTGYASLMQTDDYTLIAHPEWDTDLQGENDPIPILTDIEKNSNGTEVFSTTMMNTIVSGIDVISYTRDGENFFLSFAPITDSNGNDLYTFMISVPESEVFIAVNDIDNKINTAKITVISSTILLSIITTVVVLFIGLWISNSITKPLARLTTIAKQLTNNITKKNIFEGIDLDSDEINQDDEIGDLARSFTDMVQYLRDEQKTKKSK